MKAPRSITVEFSEEAFAMLEVLRVYDDHASMADLVRYELSSSVACLFESIHKEKAAEFFAAPEQEGRAA